MVIRNLCACVLVCLVPMGFGQFSNNPFVDYTEALGTAHGFEMLGIRLTSLTESEEVDTELVEELEGAMGRDFPRIYGSLSAQDPELAGNLGESLEELEELIEAEDEAFYDELSATLALIAEARALVIPAELATDPAFSAALMSLILLAEEGVAERFEEAAAGEETAYLGGWAALQRIKAMWAELEPLANENQSFEINDMMRELESIFPSTETPGAEAFMDPEAAEDPAQRMVGFLEELSNASLYPDRDLGQLIGLSRDLTQSACQEIETGNVAAGEQRLKVAGFYYGQYLANTIGMMQPEANENLEPLWFVFSEGAEEDEEGEEAEAEALDCPELLENFEQIAAMFGI